MRSDGRRVDLDPRIEEARPIDFSHPSKEGFNDMAPGSGVERNHSDAEIWRNNRAQVPKREWRAWANAQIQWQNWRHSLSRLGVPCKILSIEFKAKEQKGYKRAERNKVVPRDWNTIRKDMWGIKKMILYETSFDAPYHDWPLVRENLKAVRRQQGGKPDHRKPLTSYLMKAVPPIYYWRH